MEIFELYKARWIEVTSMRSLFDYIVMMVYGEDMEKTAWDHPHANVTGVFSCSLRVESWKNFSGWIFKLQVWELIEEDFV